MNKSSALKMNVVRRTIFSLSFVSLSVVLPIITHFFAGSSGGRLFLPMQLFIFVSALLLGAQAGAVIGIISALVSFSLTGMPAFDILPVITLELALYGFLAGYLFRNRKWNICSSLLGSMIFGRMTLLAVIYILPVKISAITYVFGATKAGLIGIAIQLIIIPLIYNFSKKYISDESL